MADESDDRASVRGRFLKVSRLQSGFNPRLHVARLMNLGKPSGSSREDAASTSRNHAILTTLRVRFDDSVLERLLSPRRCSCDQGAESLQGWREHGTQALPVLEPNAHLICNCQP